MVQNSGILFSKRCNDESRAAREKFTYYVTKSAEEHHAQQAIIVAQEFIVTVRELMMKK